jgi:3-hydroxybutyryl-CoA dehydrogenase
MSHKTETVGVLGGGVIGASWASLFTASGYPVRVFDPADGAEAQIRSYAERAAPTLKTLGLACADDPAPMTFCASAADAVEGAVFVQESVPERIEIKHALFAEIEPVLAPGAVVASSASGLMVSEMQEGWQDPGRLILGHPFNPPHLIPLVELLANERTDTGVLEKAEAFYAGCGKVTIRLNKEVPGHAANRLQAALWREAISLVAEGVASVEDVDKAVWAGPGLRWAAMGPHMLFHLGAGELGLGEFCSRYEPSFRRWWDSMKDITLDEKTVAALSGGIAEEQGGREMSDLMAERDALIVAMLRGAAAERSDKS